MANFKIIEIAPRDGFQSVDKFIKTEIKKTIIDKLIASGLTYIQATSFISPKAIPQMADADEIVKYCLDKYKDINFFALTPNIKGVKRAYEMGLREVTYVISVSESHNLANVRRTVNQSLEELALAIEAYPDMKINLDLATAFGCPFEGETSYSKLETVINKAYKLGIRTFDICDTVGVAYPLQVKNYMKKLINTYKDVEFGIHIHDTRNMGMLNTYIAVEEGAKRVFSVCGGLGGCPFAPGASGNTATEDLVNMFQLCGYDMGVDIGKLIETAKYMKVNIPTGNFSSHSINISECTETSS